MKRILASLGLGNASVETVLRDPNTVPGGVLQGDVYINGGSVDQHIQELTVGLQARAEVEHGDAEHSQNLEFARARIGGELQLQADAHVHVPFELPVPWEAPLTAYRGQHLTGMHVGLNTQLHVAGGVDPGDLDPVSVHAMETQTIILDAVSMLGFRFMKADCERGRIRDTSQKLPFYQEVEYRAPSGYAGLNELEVTFITDERACDLILELDKKGGLFTEGRDSFKRMRIEHGTVEANGLAHQLNDYLGSVVGDRPLL
ncbi:sporulation-control protein [Haloactinospora alba]|uniref:Sporulation-control protein n=1 Tax=Haloactinospora alba TaxID=405555 RepID=A0A543NLX4_9ACTN|nr:sporulation protein [Haloactinospora alba]TQN32809.1 sporulation-control protein [Haloactinospora alba]